MVRPVRYVLYERDDHGAAYAVEVVEAIRWDDRFLAPPPADEADVRVVRLRRGAPPDRLPRWLRVEAGTRRAAEVAAPYITGGHPGPADERETPAAAPSGRSLWPWSPYHRAPGPGLNEFLSAGASAVRHPDPSPADARRRALLLCQFASGREPPLAQVAALRGDALERWLHYAFGDPGRFAEAVLLARIDDEAPDEVREALHFLAEAEVAEDGDAHLELAIDRRVLREQASPWRYFEGVPFAGALSAVQAWRRRYRLAYESHYRAVLGRAAGARVRLEQARPAASALERLNAVRALGAPAGEEALAAYAAAAAALETLPAEPDARAARTAGVTLGREPAMFADAVAATAAVADALEVQRRRLASRAVRFVLGRQSVPALDRLLQAITASDIDGIERVLDEDLAAHIDRLLAGAAETPLTALAARFPAVTAATLEDAVEAFRELLAATIAGADDGRAVLREDAVAAAS